MEILCFLSEEEKFIFNILKDFFQHKGIKAYLVGGAVRDALLKKTPKDIDICVNKDPQEFIKEIPYADKVKYHRRFKTSSILFNNGVQIDIIRCRKEHYTKNGALPKVYPSDIKDDLARRDFTVNAIAYDLLNEKLIDPYNGVRDIELKKIVKIKENTYREDPTRIFRAIRYSVRYGFRLEDEREILQCVNEKVFYTISNDRTMKELILMAEENKWEDMFKKCSYFKIMDLCNNIDHEQILICYEDLIDRLCNIYIRLNNAWLKEIFKNNALLDTKLKRAFENYKNIEKSLMESRDNYKIFGILEKCNVYHIILLSYNKKVLYKIMNYNRMNSEYKEIKAKDILVLGIEQGKLIGDIIEYVKSLSLNTGLEIEKEYLMNNIGEIVNGIKYKNT